MLCHCAQKAPFCKRGHELTVSVGDCKDRCQLPPVQDLDIILSPNGYSAKNFPQANPINQLWDGMSSYIENQIGIVQPPSMLTEIK